MKLINFFHDFNLQKKDIKFLFLLLIYSLIIFALIALNSNLEVQLSDVIIYMSNGLKLAGFDINGLSRQYYMYLSPFYCFLISILIRIGIDPFFSIKYLCGFFYICGGIIFYIFLKLKFNEILSFSGSILFLSTTTSLLCIRDAGVDIPAVTLSILAILFFIQAVDINPKYYIFSGIFIVLAIFTRYTAILMLPLMILYLISKFDLNKTNFNQILKSNEFKYLLIWFLIVLILSSIFCLFIVGNGCDLTFLRQGSDSINAFDNNKQDIYYNNDFSFYLEHFANDFSVNFIVFLVLCCILFVGFFLKITNLIKKISYENLNKKVFCIFIIFLILGILSIKLNYLVSDILILISLISLMFLFKKLELDENYYPILILCIGWFVIYFIFFSYINIKMNRYILPVYPAFIFLVIYALDSIFNFKKVVLSNYLLILLIIVIMLCSFIYVDEIEYRQDIDDVIDVVDFIKNEDLNYSEKTIATNKKIRFFEWYFQKQCIQLNSFNLDSKNADYLILNKNEKIDNYHQIYNNSEYYVYNLTC